MASLRFAPAPGAGAALRRWITGSLIPELARQHCVCGAHFLESVPAIRSKMDEYRKTGLDDLDRIFEFNFQADPAAALDHINKIRSAVLILDTHPEFGRRLRGHSSLRELVVSHGKSGYIALYEYSPAESLVRVVAVRHQHEAGYRSV